MRSPDVEQPSLFSYSQTADSVPTNHSVRPIRSLVNAARDSMSGMRTISYPYTDRPGIASGSLIRALLLQILYSIHSERQLVEQLRYNMLFRWFVGLSLDDAVWEWDATTFNKNRQNFFDGALTSLLLEAVADQARQRRLLSEQHFCMDGTLIDAWASMDSCRRTDDDSDLPDLTGQRRRSATHECKKDSDIRPYKKAQGQPSRLCYIGHVLTANRHAPVIDAETTRASGTSEVDAALKMLDRRPGKHHVTVDADKNYDQRRFVEGRRQARVPPHFAQNTHSRRSTIDKRTTRHAGYEESINSSHRVETQFGQGIYAHPLKQTMLVALSASAPRPNWYLRALTWCASLRWGWMSVNRHSGVSKSRSLNGHEQYFDQIITSESIWAAGMRAASENFWAILAP